MAATKRISKFEKLCREVSEKTDIEVIFFDDEHASDAHEDDGNLHVTRRGLMACFDVGGGQELSASRQNDRTRTVLRGLGMESAINEHTLVDETEDDEDDDEYCPHCGR